jgi:hypothetical protein
MALIYVGGVLLRTDVIEGPLSIGRHPTVKRRKFPIGRGAIGPFEGDSETKATQFPISL